MPPTAFDEDLMSFSKEEFPLIDNDILTLAQDVNIIPGTAELCQFCQTFSNLEPALFNVGHYICRNCLKERRDTHHYRTISQGHALKKFGLSLKDLQQYERELNTTLINSPSHYKLAIKEMLNPKGYGNPMKLYYEFQLLDICVRKYGSFEAAMLRIDEKEEEKFTKTVGSLLFSNDTLDDTEQLSRFDSTLSSTKKTRPENNTSKKTLQKPNAKRAKQLTHPVELVGEQSEVETKNLMKSIIKNAQGVSRKSQERLTHQCKKKDCISEGMHGIRTNHWENMCQNHIFNETIFNNDNTFEKTCITCGIVEKWEEIS